METGFQICPKCEGTGKKVNILPMTGIPMIDIGNMGQNTLTRLMEFKGMNNTCIICNGKMIISTSTGKPPLDSI